MGTLLVITWGTDKIGKMAIRAILDDPRLKLVGVYTGSDAEAGLDAGELCGRSNCGVVATKDLNSLVSLGADTVIYTIPQADLSHVTTLLAKGHDIISTNPFHQFGGLKGDVKAKIEDACIRGNSSLHITGLFPGWIDTVAAATTAICSSIDSISITELAYCAHYESLETWQSVGMGLSEVTSEVVETARHFFSPFYDTVFRLADLLGFKLDSVDFAIEHATASEKVDLGWLCIEEGTHAAIRASWQGKMNGRIVVQTRMVWYLSKLLNADWEFSDDIYHVVVEGEPSVDTRIRITTPKSWTNTERATPTAMPAVNAVFQVAAAPPGILGISDAGLPYARKGNSQER